MIETEIEIKVESLAATRKVLKKKGKLLSRFKSRDFFFYEELFSQDILLRLRDIKFQFPQKKKEAVVTYKTPKKIKGGIQIRKEIEFKTDSFDAVFKVFQEIFSKPILTFTWTGEKYKYGKCTIWLKDTYGIVKFVEIEGEKGEIKKAKRELAIKGEILKIGALEFAKRKIRGSLGK
jgi:predicted adenylyl cyclase CyaB